MRTSTNSSEAASPDSSGLVNHDTTMGTAGQGTVHESERCPRDLTCVLQLLQSRTSYLSTGQYNRHCGVL